MSDLNYNHLRYFWAVAHEGNLTRAAERLHVSQSAVSTQIQKLEEELRHALFERRGRRLLLTEAGRIALDHADVIFAAGQELLGTLQEGAGLDRITLRVGALSTLSRNFQLRFFGPLLRRDDVDLVVRSGVLRELLASLEAHRLDVVLANYSPPRDSNTAWVSHPIASQPISLVGHAERLAGRTDWRALIEAEPLVLPAIETSIRSGFDVLVDQLGIRPRIAAEVDDMAMLRLLARENMGLAVAPPIVVRDELADGELVEVSPLPGLKEIFYAITTSRRFPNPLLRELIVSSRA